MVKNRRKSAGKRAEVAKKPVRTGQADGRSVEQPQVLSAQCSLVRVLVLAASVAVLVLLGGWISGGKGLAEKATIRLVQPVGVCWLLFSGWCIEVSYVRLRKMLASRAGLSRREASSPIASTTVPELLRLAIPPLAWLLFMVFTTTPLCSWCVAYLESGVESYRPESGEPLAAVVVLGGGTHQGPWRAEVAGAGDRVLYAAEIFHQGYAKRLITTGEAMPGVSRDATSPSQHTKEIWTKLNIPEAAIGTLKGQNTYQEMQDLKQHWSEFEGGRVGLLTSALHLPRAMRLARAQGLEVLPIAADHAANDAPLNYLDFIPSAGPLCQLAACQHELMAWLVKR